MSFHQFLRRSLPHFVFTALFVVIGLASQNAYGDEYPLYQARALTKPGEFTPGIEGPQCDRAGNIYAVNFAKQQTIGKVTPAGKGEIFLTLPGKSTGNGIVFDSAGRMYIADYVGHNVLRVNMESKEITTFAHHDEMNQPNDVAIAPNGTLYASDPAWDKNSGQIWFVSLDGKTSKVAADMGTTNGIEVSPDGKNLYVNESVQRNVWKFDIASDGTLTNKKLIKQFEDHGFDGMRCDESGNLYITRYGKGTVAIMSPAGEILKEIDVLGKMPSNLCFGGPDGKTVYVTEVEHTRLVEFRVERAGLAWKRWSESK